MISGQCMYSQTEIKIVSINIQRRQNAAASPLTSWKFLILMTIYLPSLTRQLLGLPLILVFLPSVCPLLYLAILTHPLLSHPASGCHILLLLYPQPFPFKHQLELNAHHLSQSMGHPSLHITFLAPTPSTHNRVAAHMSPLF